MSDFDEFADLEKELNEEIRYINAEDIVREIEENKSDLFFIIQRQAVSGGPVRKIMGLIVGILLIPLLDSVSIKFGQFSLADQLMNIPQGLYQRSIQKNTIQLSNID